MDAKIITALKSLGLFVQFLSYTDTEGKTCFLSEDELEQVLRRAEAQGLEWVSEITDLLVLEVLHEGHAPASKELGGEAR